MTEEKFWLMKSEPEAYSIDTLKKDGVTLWDGIRNYQARNFMRNMNNSEEFKPSLKQINEDIRPTWEDIKKQSEILVNKLGCPRSFVGGMLHAIASDFSDMKTWE